jgi:hypothetical protein
MRLKGISAFEQHVEKIVLVVMVVVLLAVVSLQFLTRPNMIDAGGEKIGPAEVFGQLETEVNKLRASVEDPQPPLPEVTTPKLITELDAALSREDALPGQLDVAFGPGAVIGGDESVGAVADGPIMPMTIAEPVSPTAYSMWVTADPFAVEDNEALAAYVPTEQPYDMVGVSFETVIDGALTQQLLREGDDSHRPIPATWWRSGVAVLEVVAERQELGLDGSWSEATPVGKFPGGFDVMADFEADPTPLELRDIVQRAQDAAEGIVHPDYIPQIAGPEWVPPAQALERDEQYANMSDVDLLRAKRRSLLDTIERLETQLAEGPKGSAGQPDRSGGGGGIVQPGKGSRPNTRDPGEADRKREERRVANIQQQIETKTAQVTEIETQLATLGFPVASDEPATTAIDTASAPDDETRFLGNEQYRVWTHDLDVVAGAVYRYRMRVKVNNPIYGKERSLNPSMDDMELAKQPYAFSAWSSWSEPVMVGRESYLFLTGAEEAGRARGAQVVGGGSARVTAEVFQMYYGHYRRGSVTLEPGDVAATEVRVPDKLYLFDTAVVSADVAHSLLGVVPQERDRFTPPQPMGPGNRVPTADPNEFIIPVGPSERTGRDPRQSRPAPQEVPEEPEVLPEGVTPAPTRIPVRMDATLLEVVQLPIGESGGDGEKALYYAYFETEGGQVEHRRPDRDRETAAYELVRASYLLGQATGTGEDE